DLVLDASWDVPTDLDVAIIDARGNRISWMGGRRTGITTRGAKDAYAEGLGLGRISTGEYIVEISRAVSNGRGVRGTVTINALGERRTVGFALAPGEATERVARVNVTREEQLVPVNTPWRR